MLVDCGALPLSYRRLLKSELFNDVKVVSAEMKR